MIRGSFRCRHNIVRPLLVRRYTKGAPARTRFAPSPTGHLHLGSLRTALYNYLWAKKTGGQFLVRVEDTDQNRLYPGAEDSLFDNLRWAKLDVDEGPEGGGDFGPYRQSERLEIYRNHLETLLNNDSAYRCFCSAERLADLRDSARKNGLSGTYDRNCEHICKSEATARANAGEAHVVRLKTPSVYPTVEDIVYGSVKFHHNATPSSINYDDPILMKSDGFPTYHFANVVDDHLMQITHVIRGEEWLPSTPKHLALYAAFGWTPPEFAHVPLLASPSGAKLSKRHGDVTVEDYRRRGFLPEALLNYLALMGWNAKVDNEVMTLQDMIDRFDLGDITKGASIVTPEKLSFLQKQHFIRATGNPSALHKLVRTTQAVLQKDIPDQTYPDEYVAKVIVALRERIVDPLGIPELGIYFFKDPDYTGPAARKFARKFQEKQNMPLPDLLSRITSELKQIEDAHWDGVEFNEKIEKLFKDIDWKVENSQIMGAVRYAVAGGLSGAGVKQIMQIIGRARTLERLAAAQSASL